MTPHPRLARYLALLRSPAKRAYARAYLAWLQSGEAGQEPAHADLPFMAGQAVRMNIRDYLSNPGKDT